MTITVKNKTELVVPASVRRRAGIKAGDRLEFKVSGGIINIIPKLPLPMMSTPPSNVGLSMRELPKA